jgi:hypothetical protein
MISGGVPACIRDLNMRNLVALLCGLCVFSWTLGLIGEQAPTARLEGVVVDAKTGAPIPGARIQLTPRNLRAFTDELGEFVLDELPLGSYVLTAEKAGYVSARPEGRKIPGNAGLPLNLEAGQSQKRVVSLHAAGIVTGRVLDDSGQPVQTVNIIPSRYAYDDFGRRSFRYFGSVQTNDLGEYRFNNLAPGDYVLRVEPQSPRLGQAAASAFRPVYYPGVLDFNGALTVSVVSGVEVRLSDIVISSAIGRALTVHIEAVGAERIPGVITVRRVGDVNSVFSGPVPAGGRGTIGILIPGVYAIEANLIIGGIRLRNQTTVEMAETDAEVRIVMPAPGSVVGSATVQAVPNQPVRPLADVQVQLSLPSSLLPANVMRTTGRDGTFTIPNLSPGIYFFRVIAPASAYLSGIRRDDVAMFNQQIEVRAGETVSLNLDFAEPAVNLEGIVTDSAGKGVPGAAVVLVPNDRSRSHLFRASSTDGNGRFTLNGAPGDYRLYSWREIEGAPYRDSEFMRKYDEEGRLVRLEATGQPAHLTLKILDE